MLALDITITKVDIAIITAIKGNSKYHQAKHQIWAQHLCAEVNQYSRADLESMCREKDCMLESMCEVTEMLLSC